MRLYGEVERIFSGVRQVENALDALSRENQGRLAIGAMAASGGTYIQRATTAFQVQYPSVFCSVRTLHSQWIVDWLVTRKLDVGLVSARVDNPYLKFEPAMELPLICILPPNHQLAEKTHIEPQDLHEMPFVGFPSDTYIGHMVDGMFDRYDVRPHAKVVANAAPTVCEFVAAGAGASLVHPLWISGMEDKLVLKRFDPEILYHIQLCRSQENRNAKIIDAFFAELHSTADNLSKIILDRVAMG
jgi:DNA-binding transcriptional LysR family regulator